MTSNHKITFTNFSIAGDFTDERERTFLSVGKFLESRDSVLLDEEGVALLVLGSPNFEGAQGRVTELKTGEIHDSTLGVD